MNIPVLLVFDVSKSFGGVSTHVPVRVVQSPDVTDANASAMTAYIAMRAAHDHVTVTRNQALAELLSMGGINQAGTSSGPAVKPSGNRFAPSA
jgi:hypothetical protein